MIFLRTGMVLLIVGLFVFGMVVIPRLLRYEKALFKIAHADLNTPASVLRGIANLAVH